MNKNVLIVTGVHEAEAEYGLDLARSYIENGRFKPHFFSVKNNKGSHNEAMVEQSIAYSEIQAEAANYNPSLIIDVHTTPCETRDGYFKLFTNNRHFSKVESRPFKVPGIEVIFDSSLSKTLEDLDSVLLNLEGRSYIQFEAFLKVEKYDFAGKKFYDLLSETPWDPFLHKFLSNTPYYTKELGWAVTLLDDIFDLHLNGKE